MSIIRVFLTIEDLESYVDCHDGFSMVVTEDGFLEVSDDMDNVVGLFQTWDHAVLVALHEEFPRHASSVRIIAPVEAEIEEEEDEDEDGLEADDEDNEDEDDGEGEDLHVV